jgi:glycosyltransferase involved in cell wall biosynthesis
MELPSNISFHCSASKMNAKVSILLPSLNQRKFLDERVQSLFKQTLAGWEAIVLDSGSSDGSWEFFQSIAKRDSRFHLHQIPREGLYAALNRGFDLATAEFIHIATADDSMAPRISRRNAECFRKMSASGHCRMLYS